MAATGIECESFFQNKVDSMLVTTSWVDELKHLLGIEAVSQIWGNVPAWYMWFSKAQGVYRLQLAEAMIEEKNPDNRQGFFSINCYPFHHTAVFETFSYEEQVLSRSDWFDETHTPRFEKKENVPDSLFNVAVLEYRVNQDETMACFTLESLDTLRCLYPEETALDFDLIGKKRLFRRGEIGRSVPGWQLGYPVFDRLLCMYAFYSKSKPVRVRITRSTGFEYIHTGNHAFACRNTPATHRWTASVFFESAKHTGGETDLNQQDIIAPEEETNQIEILLDYSIPGDNLHPSEMIASMQTVEEAPLNSLWWSLADAVYTSNLASTCGCH